MLANKLSDNAQIDFSEGIAAKTSALPSDIPTIFISKAESFPLLLTDHLNRVKTKRTADHFPKRGSNIQDIFPPYIILSTSVSAFSQG
jgi:hypothetical protein